MIDRQQLLKDLQRELPKIEADILQYSESQPELGDHLQEEYQKAVNAGRTSEHFVTWREAQITQAAVSWVLTCVFVRFLEDNGLLDEPMLAGPVERQDGSRPLQHAKERITAYFNELPTHAERDYLLSLFEELEQYPVIDELLDHRHNPLWQIKVSADGAKRLVDFFQRIDPATGELVHDFTDPQWDTRFLGDLYQDLSESVRKRYALLQTPEFVESFILDYTLEKAKETFGLEGLRLIDPTCGSGHFLLTSFERMFDAWQCREPGINARHLAQRALDVVHGVDINPYAIAIARFRLLIAAMKAAGSTKVKSAPDFHFHLAVGDSLLHGRRFEWQGQGIQTDLIDEDPIRHVLEVEDKERLLRILGQRYHAVVGNPPYITASDNALNQAYRERYLTCHRKFSLGVPFTERFFELALPAEQNKQAGYVGMITTNSFTKREFGKKLIEQYLPKKDLTHVIDTSGCQIPGHGTPTVILFARNRPPAADYVRAVLGIKGEPSTVKDAAQGKVWLSIVEHLDKPGAQSEFVSVEDRERAFWSSHPWSLEGGSAGELMDKVETAASKVLDDFQDELGFGAITGEDDLYTGHQSYFNAQGIDSSMLRTFVEGDVVRNWGIDTPVQALYPYSNSIDPLSIRDEELRTLWLSKTVLRRRVYFGRTQDERGLKWYEYGYISKGKCSAKFLLAFAFVATHNHFVLDRGSKVFKQSAPVIKLPNGTSEADHLVLLGLLNSSIACFWGRQVFFPKGGFSEGKWEERLEWDGTKLKRFPIPKPLTSDANSDSRLLPDYDAIETIARQLDELGQQLSKLRPNDVLAQAENILAVTNLDNNRRQAIAVRARMVALQEELDWLCYYAYGITSELLIYVDELPEVNAGQRAFEIQMARALDDEGGSGAWFTRHQLTQTTELPEHWSEGYCSLVAQRLALMASDRFIGMLERPEYKRRWLPLEWDKQEREAIRYWLLSYLERQSFDVAHPALSTCARLADSINHNELAQTLARRYTGTEMFDAQTLVSELIADDQVPLIAAARLKPTAIKKFRAWQETWDKQRQEDAIDAEFGVAEPLSEEDAKESEKVAAWNTAKKQAEAKKAREIGTIAMPPKYAATDFRKANYWSLRGKLDVPKERFFSLPGCEKPGDATLVIGWAGMNHLQRAQAIAGWYMERKQSDGWETEQLVPMLVALDELIPWLKQWHNDLDPEFGERMGDFYEGFLFEELREHELTRDDLLSWQPAESTQRRGRRRIQAADL